MLVYVVHSNVLNCTILVTTDETQAYKHAEIDGRQVQVWDLNQCVRVK